MKKIVYLILLSLLFFWPYQSLAYLAKVNGEEVGIKDFKQYLVEFHLYEQMHPKEKKGKAALTTEALEQKLKKLIDEYLMAQEAKRLGLDQDSSYLKNMNDVRKELALSKFWQEEVKKMNITDKVLKNYYNRRLTKIHVRQIFTKDKKKAQKALKRLKSGKSFSEVAKVFSEDPFAQRGGDMGLVTRGRMADAWEKVAFSLKPGEISDIVKTDAGYHIIKVEKIISPKPEIFEKDKTWFKKQYIKQKLKERRKELTTALRKKAKIEINHKLFEKIDVNDKESTGILAKVNGEEIRVEAFLPALKKRLWGAKAMAKRWHFKIDEKKIKKSVLDQMINDSLLAQEALKKGYFRKDKNLQNTLKKFQRYFLATLFKQKIIAPQVKIEEKELKEYYQRHKEEFRAPTKYKLSLIKVSTKKEAEEIREELIAGADFSLLARKKSKGSSAKKGGLLGWISEDKMPSQVKEAVSKLKPGDISPVIKDNGKYIVLKLEEKKLGEQLPYEKVKMDIEKKLWYRKFNKMLSKYLKELRRISKIEIDKATLKKLEEEFKIRS
ncbi:MAG: peptidylprolyl isomerase [Candidatus Desulfofervidaceae bacterium]|nr:peptidylprolyl isomerase [Candidatus Desulfofervidaceae bacterium]